MISVHCCGGKLMSTIFPIWEDLLAAYWLYQQLVCSEIEYSVQLETLSVACLSTDNANMLIFIKHNKNFYDRF